MRYHMHGGAGRRSGYTLIELLLVVGLLGLAASLLVPQMINLPSLRAQSAVRRIIGDLSFAQSDALAHQGYRRVHFFEDGSGYCIFRVTEANYGADFDPDTADYIVDPLMDGIEYVVDFTQDDRFEGVTITDVNIDGGRTDIVYDDLGGTVAPGSVPGFGGTMRVTSAEESYILSIAPFTGKMTVTRADD